MDFDHAIPHAVDIEQAVLGAILRDAALQPRFSSLLVPALFYDSRHRTTVEALRCLWAEVAPAIDHPELVSYLRQRNLLATAGEVVYLMDLISTHAGSPLSLLRYLGELRRVARLRAQQTAGLLLQSRSSTVTSDPAEVLEQARALIEDPDLAEPLEASGAPEEVANRLVDLYDAARAAAMAGMEFTGLDVGFKDLNVFTNGLGRGELTVVAARPAIGKTTLALQIALHAAVHGVGVGFFSLEMSTDQVGARLATILGGVNPDLQRRGRLPEDQEGRYYTAVARYAGLPLHVYSERSMVDIRARIARVRQERPIGLWIIDHLHRITGSPGDAEHQRLNAAAEDVANLALEVNAPILLLAQLNRECEQRPDKRPQLSDLRGSGGIEEHAVNVWLLYRPGHYRELRAQYSADPERLAQLQRDAVVLVEKQRFGTVGDVQLAWDPEHALFDSAAPAWRQEPPTARTFDHPNN